MNTMYKKKRIILGILIMCAYGECAHSEIFLFLGLHANRVLGIYAQVPMRFPVFVKRPRESRPPATRNVIVVRHV